MIVGSIFFILKQIKYNFKFTLMIFISVILGLGVIGLYNYKKNFSLARY